MVDAVPSASPKSATLKIPGFAATKRISFSAGENPIEARVKVLVDYENIPKIVRSQGAVYVADRILQRINPQLDPNSKLVDFKMYGGWDENSKLTRRAQDLEAELKNRFPRDLRLSEQPPRSVRLNAALAHSLEVTPKKLMTNTVRTTPFEKQLICASPHDLGCTNPRCPLAPMEAFFQGGTCPVAGCRLTPSVLLKSVQQKLVDTMLVADLVHLGHRGERQITVVTSDDDIWPGILAALSSGAHVLHVQTLGQRPSLPYLTGIQGKYTQFGL